MILTALLLTLLPTGLMSVDVYVPDTQRSTTLFASIVLRCDYSSSANAQDILVTWIYKSFCRDPVLDYYSAGYQATLAQGLDPTNDCPDSQRTIRTVIQKSGTNEPTLGAEYRNRRITIQNKANLAIVEVMWWDNGVYYCSVDAPGDTTGDSDREVKLIVYNWLTVLFIILGILLLLILLCVCCCQCCPQKCCCYVRCPCCPQTCCCPEKIVMQQRMVKEAQKAVGPWQYGQAVYSPIGSANSQGQPHLYAASYSEPSKQNKAVAHRTPSPFYTPVPPHHHANSVHANGSVRSKTQGTHQMLDYLENQMQGMDLRGPMPPLYLPPPHLPAQQPPPQNLPLQHLPPLPIPRGGASSSGPPSILSALGEMGVHGVERRVIRLPPIIQRVPSTHRHRQEAPPRRGILRSHSDESDWEERRAWRRNGRGSGALRRASSGAHGRNNTREEFHSPVRRRERSYSPPPPHSRASWSSDEDIRRGGEEPWPEKPPPSYSSLNTAPGKSQSRSTNDRNSDKSSRSPTSVVI